MFVCQFHRRTRTHRCNHGALILSYFYPFFSHPISVLWTKGEPQVSIWACKNYSDRFQPLGLYDGDNQSPTGNIWSSVPLPCFSLFVEVERKQGSGPEEDESPVEHRGNSCLSIHSFVCPSIHMSVRPSVPPPPPGASEVQIWPPRLIFGLWGPPLTAPPFFYEIMKFETKSWPGSEAPKCRVRQIRLLAKILQ